MGNRAFLYLSSDAASTEEATPVADANNHFPALWRLLLAGGSAGPAIDGQRVFGDAGTDSLRGDASAGLARLDALAAFVSASSDCAARAPWLAQQFAALQQFLGGLVESYRETGEIPQFCADLDELSWMVEEPDRFIEDCQLDCEDLAQDVQQAIDSDDLDALFQALDLSHFGHGIGDWDAWANGFGFAGLGHRYFSMHDQPCPMSFAEYVSSGSASAIDDDEDFDAPAPPCPGR